MCHGIFLYNKKVKKKQNNNLCEWHAELWTVKKPVYRHIPHRHTESWRSQGSAIEPTTSMWGGNGANRRATSCTALCTAAGRVREEKREAILAPEGQSGAERTASIISNQAFSCGQSGPSHVTRHAHFHFLPNTTTPCPAVSSPTFVCLDL